MFDASFGLGKNFKSFESWGNGGVLCSDMLFGTSGLVGSMFVLGSWTSSGTTRGVPDPWDADGTWTGRGAHLR